MSTIAPIVLFTYKRPQHLEKVLQALQRNSLFCDSDLHVFCDGPKLDASTQDLENIYKTREIVKTISGCKKLYITYRDQNLGLQQSVINGVSTIVEEYGEVIVLEDDIITSPFFLQYMNDALNMYRASNDVLSIGACNFFVTGNDVPETFFIPIPDCWGWATWLDRWQLFEPNAQILLNHLREKNLVDEFNLGGRYNFEGMLIDQLKGNVNSWAIRWQALAYVSGKLSLYPRESVSFNIGFDATGTNGGIDKYSKYISLTSDAITIEKLNIKTLPIVTQKLLDGYTRISIPPLARKTKTAIRNIVKSLAPPLLVKFYNQKRKLKVQSWWKGDYESWEVAKNDSTGYDENSILEKTLNATLKVKKGEASYERDTVLFDKPEFNWPLITTLLRAAIENSCQLSVIDFGGSLGSVYFQNRAMLLSINSLQWAVVEQAHYAKIGNDYIANEHLHFFTDIKACLMERSPNTLLLSGVLQYIEHPYLLMKTLMDYQFKYIIVDRTAFCNSTREILTIQEVPDYIYSASYPAWFFNKQKFLKAFFIDYELISDFDPYGSLTIPLDNNITGYYKGFIFKRKN